MLWLTVCLAGTLTLTDEAWFADDDLVLERDGHRVEMPRGYLFGVQADGEAAGVVFVGTGRTQTELSPREAQQLGNYLVLGGDASREQMQRTVARGAHEEEVDTVLVLGLDAPALVDGLRRVAVETGVEGYYDERGEFQVVVIDQRFGPSRRRAAERLNDRQKALAAMGLDPHDAVKLDRHEDRDRWVVDAHGHTSFHAVVPDALAAPRSRWATWIEDPTGAVDDRHEAVWLANGWVAREHGEVGATKRMAGREGEPTGARLGRLVANAVVEPNQSGVYVDVGVESLATFRSDAPSRVVRLHIPCHEAEVLYEQVTVAPRCGVDAITVDGLELKYIGRGFGGIHPLDQGGVYLLPEEQPAGEAFTLRVRHHDRLSFGPVVLGPEETARRARKDVSLGASPGEGLADLMHLGPITEPADVLPYGTRPYDPVQVELRAASVHPRYQVSLSGRMDQPFDKGQVEWSVVTETSRPRLTVGDFDGEETFGGALGMPSVRILAQDAALEADLEVVSRATVNFFLDALPPFPYGELEIVQGADVVAWEFGDKPLPRPQVVTVPGQMHLYGVQSVGDAGRIIRSRWPRNLNLEIAEGVAAQWWRPSERPYRDDDAWIGQAMPRFYGELFLDHAYKEKVVRMWRELPRDALGDEELAERETQRLGSLFHGLVRARVGERRLLEGLHDFLTAGGRTTAELQEALSQATGDDLADVFDVWLDGRFEPELKASWAMQGEQLEVALRTELPFGHIRVPVEVVSGRDRSVHWVHVTDGVGTARLPLHGTLREVRVDPEGLLPWSRIRTEEGPGLARY